jgi:hypothetical protein
MKLLCGLLRPRISPFTPLSLPGIVFQQPARHGTGGDAAQL